MPSTAHLTGFATALALLGALSDAHADERERRLSVAALGSLATLDAYETRDTTAAYGLGGEYALGLSHLLELGGSLRYQARPDTVFGSAQVGAVGGTPDFELYANLHLIEAAATARLNLEVGPFARIRPVVDLRLGVAMRFLTNPLLYYRPSAMAADAAAENRFDVLPLASIAAGIARRTTGSLQYALLAGYTRATTYYAIDLHLQLSWFSY